jgi:hypothetical protein
MVSLPYLLIRRAVGRVIKIFRRQNAISVESARTIDELGLRPRTWLQGMFRGRDYKPQALDILLKADIVQMTEDSKLFLSEEKLAASKLSKGRRTVP